jgi:hypothetical protein
LIKVIANEGGYDGGDLFDGCFDEMSFVMELVEDDGGYEALVYRHMTKLLTSPTKT